MKCFRRRRLRARIAILATIGLLWSQFVLAGHPACSLAVMAMAELDAPAAAEPSCHQQAPATDEALCAAHCAKGEQTNDVARIPSLPSLPATTVISLTAVCEARGFSSIHLERPPPVSWHRPTAHPAALLLI